MAQPNPRKFAEKIALLQQKEREQSRQFQQIIQEVNETTRLAKPSPLQHSRLLYSASLPNLQQSSSLAYTGAPAGIDLQHGIHDQFGGRSRVDMTPYHMHTSARKQSAPAPLDRHAAGGLPAYPMAQSHPQQAWRNARTHPVPKTYSDSDLVANVPPLQPVESFPAVGEHPQDSIRNVKVNVGQMLPPSTLHQSSPGVYHDNLSSKTTSMPNLCERLPGCAVPPYATHIDSAEDLAQRGTRVASADGAMYGGRMVDPSLAGGFPQPVGRGAARRGGGGGGGVMKPPRRSGSGLLRSKPYSPAASSSVPELSNAESLSQPQPTFSPGVQQQQALSRLPNDLRQAAINASAQPSFLGGLQVQPSSGYPDSSVASPTTMIPASSSWPAQQQSQARLTYKGTGSPTRISQQPHSSNSHLPQMFANLKVKHPAQLAAGGGGDYSSYLSPGLAADSANFPASGDMNYYAGQQTLAAQQGYAVAQSQSPVADNPPPPLLMRTESHGSIPTCMDGQSGGFSQAAVAQSNGAVSYRAHTSGDPLLDSLLNRPVGGEPSASAVSDMRMLTPS